MSYILTGDSFRNAKLTHLFLILNIGSFIIVNLITDLILQQNYLLLMALNRILIVSEGQWWRIFTSMFFHWDIAHLFSNMFALTVFGASMEQNYKRWQYALLYFLSGLTGTFFSLVIDSPYAFGIGASGAIFGIMGATFIATARQNRTVLIFGLIYLSYDIYMSFAPGIGTWAHIFGLLAGLGVGYLFWRSNLRVNMSRSFRSREF